MRLDLGGPLDSDAIDISLPLDAGLMRWPGNPELELRPVKRLANGDDADVSELRMGTHAGTHLDLPGHTIPGGATSESLDLGALVGAAWVADVSDVAGEIGIPDLEPRIPAGTVRLLLKTGNSALWNEPSGPFPASYVALSPSAAEWLAERGVRLVAIDFLSIEARDVPGRPVHRSLLSAGVALLEGVDLRAVGEGPWHLVCLPLRLAGSDGAPARAMLVRMPDGD